MVWLVYGAKLIRMQLVKVQFDECLPGSLVHNGTYIALTNRHVFTNKYSVEHVEVWLVIAIQPVVLLGGRFIRTRDRLATATFVNWRAHCLLHSLAQVYGFLYSCGFVGSSGQHPADRTDCYVDRHKNKTNSKVPVQLCVGKVCELCNTDCLCQMLYFFTHIYI